MTARRQARGTAVRHTAPGGPPAELYDPEHPCWQSLDTFGAWALHHGLEDDGLLSAADWLLDDTHPANRRNHVAAAWGARSGIAIGPGQGDWHRLRGMGLIS